MNIKFNKMTPKLLTLKELPKTHLFTKILPPNPQISTPKVAETLSDEEIRTPKLIREGFFSYVKPRKVENAKILAISHSAMNDLGILSSEVDSDYFKNVIVYASELAHDSFDNEEIYPWAAIYGGWQFGLRAGQLGDGRAITLFQACKEINSKFSSQNDLINNTIQDNNINFNSNRHKKKYLPPNFVPTYEVQLKGAGKTPFSRFADGNAVLRSSIREFLVSEYLNALSIPSTRALGLVSLPGVTALRERGLEPCAMVIRMAPSWLRIGSFDIFCWRLDNESITKLANYAIDYVFGEKTLKNNYSEKKVTNEKNNIYIMLYWEIVKRNAILAAKCQAQVFLNGVLNTDNVSILGLAIDFGPFAFMDTFERDYTPNHDDGMLRYSFKNVPDVTWWNLEKLGENLGLVMYDGEENEKIPDDIPKEKVAEYVISTIDGIIKNAKKEYYAIYEETYYKTMMDKIGLNYKSVYESKDLIESVLDILEKNKLDYHSFFYKLGKLKLFQRDDDYQSLEESCNIFVPLEKNFNAPEKDITIKEIFKWVQVYKERLTSDGFVNDDERRIKMEKINPKFILRNWVLDEVIMKVQENNDLEFLNYVLKMALNPYKSSWGLEREMEERLCGEVPKYSRSTQCSCSS